MNYSSKMKQNNNCNELDCSKSVEDAHESSIIIILFYGCPGSGKTTIARFLENSFEFKKALFLALDSFAYSSLNSSLHLNSFIHSAITVYYFCFDKIQEDLQNQQNNCHISQNPLSSFSSSSTSSSFSSSLNYFDFSVWRNARQTAHRKVEEILQFYSKTDEDHQRNEENKFICSKKCVILLDDTFSLKSMRKEFFLLAKKHSCAYHQIFVDTEFSVCVSRNEKRKNELKVPFVVLQRQFLLQLKNACFVKKFKYLDSRFKESVSLGIDVNKSELSTTNMIVDLNERSTKSKVNVSDDDAIETHDCERSRIECNRSYYNKLRKSVMNSTEDALVQSRDVHIENSFKLTNLVEDRVNWNNERWTQGAEEEKSRIHARNNSTAISQESKTQEQKSVHFIFEKVRENLKKWEAKTACNSWHMNGNAHFLLQSHEIFKTFNNRNNFIWKKVEKEDNKEKPKCSTNDLNKLELFELKLRKLVGSLLEEIPKELKSKYANSWVCLKSKYMKEYKANVEKNRKDKTWINDFEEKEKNFSEFLLSTFTNECIGDMLYNLHLY